jgi:hypothetical protein
LSLSATYAPPDWFPYQQDQRQRSQTTSGTSLDKSKVSGFNRITIDCNLATNNNARRGNA